MADPLVSCLCPTYEPRDSLFEAIECCAAQDYQHRDMIILDDGTGWLEGANFSEQGEWAFVRYVHIPLRFHSLPEKYNALVGLASGDVLIPWEDDDLYAPHHISAHVAALEGRGWSKPTVCNQVYQGKTWRREDKNRLVRFHASVAFRRDAHGKVGGYPITRRADYDRTFQARLLSQCGPPGDPIQFDPRPSYTNRWRQSSQGSDDVEWYDRVDDHRKRG